MDVLTHDQAPAILEVGARVRSYFHTSDGSLAIRSAEFQHGLLKSAGDGLSSVFPYGFRMKHVLS